MKTVKIGKDRRKHPRISIAADLAEPVEITFLQKIPSEDGSANHIKAQRIPAILANISTGGMAMVAFGAKEIFAHVNKIQLVSNIPGLDNSKIEGKLVHVRHREGIQTLGVRFTTIAKKLKQRICHIVNDYADCETRISLHIPEVCVGNSCHFFNLCKKTQKNAP